MTSVQLIPAALWNPECGNQTSLPVRSSGDPSSAINLGGNTLSLQNLAAGTAFAGTITGTGAIDIIVTGNLDLTGNNNTYSGGTTINSGNVYADNTSGSATGSGTVTINVGGSLTIGNFSTTGFVANIPIVDNGLVDFFRTDSISFPNQINGTGGVVVQDSGSTITLTGNNTYSGLTSIDMATLKAGSPTALGNGTTAFSISSFGGTLDLNGFNISVGSITGGKRRQSERYNPRIEYADDRGSPGDHDIRRRHLGQRRPHLHGPRDGADLS